MAYKATKHQVSNRGIAPDAFLDELVAWGQVASDDIFVPNLAKDVYSSVFTTLGPYNGPEHRCAVMLEVMRVLAGFESAWNWNQGEDAGKKSKKAPETTEAGAWQVSADSMGNGQNLRDLVILKAGSDDPADFQQAMKQNHLLAMEYIARLLRITVDANGPVKRHEIDTYLRKDAVAEFQKLVFPPTIRQMDDDCTPQLRWRR